MILQLTGSPYSCTRVANYTYILENFVSTAPCTWTVSSSFHPFPQKYFLSPFHLPRYRCPSTCNEYVSLIIPKHRSWCSSYCFRGNGHRNKLLTDFFSCWRRSSSSTIVKCVIFAGIPHDFFPSSRESRNICFHSSTRNSHGIRGAAAPIPVQLSGYSLQLSIFCEMLSSATCSRNALTQTIHKDDLDCTLKSWLHVHITSCTAESICQIGLNFYVVGMTRLV